MLPEKPKRKRQPGDSSQRTFRILTLIILLMIVASLVVVMIVFLQPQRNANIDLTITAIQAQNATIAAFTNQTQNAPTATPTPLPSSTPTPAPAAGTPIPTFDSTCEGEWVAGSMFDLNRTPRVKQDFAALPDVDVQVVTQGEFCLLPNEIAPGPDYRENRVDVYLVVQVAPEDITGSSPDLTRDPAQLTRLGNLTRLLLNVLVERSVIYNNNGIVHIMFMAEDSWRTLVFTWAQYFRSSINQLTEATAVTGALGGVSDLMTR
ncbi:MAG: hypothetical protein K8L97_07135 [Anaerolineae bacterium]|nr:hypothetical protein [Anaerolineae bacterium]